MTDDFAAVKCSTDEKWVSLDPRILVKPQHVSRFRCCLGYIQSPDLLIRWKYFEEDKEVKSLVKNLWRCCLIAKDSRTGNTLEHSLSVWFSCTFHDESSCEISLTSEVNCTMEMCTSESARCYDRRDAEATLGRLCVLVVHGGPRRRQLHEAAISYCLLFQFGHTSDRRAGGTLAVTIRMKYTSSP